ALESAQIGLPHAQHMVELTETLPIEQADRVERLVLERVLTKGLHHSPSEFRAAVRRAVARVAPTPWPRGSAKPRAMGRTPTSTRTPAAGLSPTGPRWGSR